MVWGRIIVLLKVMILDRIRQEEGSEITVKPRDKATIRTRNPLRTTNFSLRKRQTIGHLSISPAKASVLSPDPQPTSSQSGVEGNPEIVERTCSNFMKHYV